MKRITIAVLASAAVLLAGAAQAQAPDFSKVEIKTTDLGKNTYMLEGQGGNITVAVGTDGVIMVDSQFAPLHDKIKAAIAKISPQPVKYVINTHYHGDHIGGNELFRKGGATIVGHDNLRIRMTAGTTNLLTGNKVPPAPADAIPTMTYQVGDMKVQVGGRTAELKHVINAHTDGDTWVYFADANVLALGDTFTNGRYPNIDWSNGGGIDGMILANERYLLTANNVEIDGREPNNCLVVICHQNGRPIIRDGCLEPMSRDIRRPVSWPYPGSSEEPLVGSGEGTPFTWSCLPDQ
jgi:glyoxylase-like metal-dependent hydrolase (beta-lactamase superfamily II)